MSYIDPVLGAIDSVLEWLTGTLYQVSGSYVELETADSRYNLVARDGSLISIIKVNGVRFLIGPDEFEDIYSGVFRSFSTAMSHPGHAIQFVFSYDNDGIKSELRDILEPSINTAKRLDLDLDDLFSEKINHLAKYCSRENNFLVLWTRPNMLSKQQQKNASKKIRKKIKDNKLPPMKDAQNLTAAISELRDVHESFVRSVNNDMNSLGLESELLDVHTALYYARESIDPDFTDREWRPYLPGDKIPIREQAHYKTADVSDVMWPTLSRQLVPRDGQNINYRTAQIGDRLYAPMFIDLFSKETQTFNVLFSRTLAARIPWRISFFIESNGLSTLNFKAAIAAILSFASSENALVADSKNLLSQIETSTDDSVVKLRVMLSTWTKLENKQLLQTRAAELAKAVQGWGRCEVGEVSGDPYGAVMASAVAISSRSIATPSIAPLSDVTAMLPITRPCSSWNEGAILFRSPDGKPWPFQPGSSKQTTWIDLIYARPGSGKSVLSNAMNLAVCVAGGLKRLPRIAIIDIGPSSCGLISLLKEALPADKQHLAAYHRMRMTPKFSINPFDTQLGSRFPTPLERSFLVNFITLLATPIGEEKPYDGVTDMAGMIIDELYKELSDNENPNRYTTELSTTVDLKLQELNFKGDSHTSWWEVVDFLFSKGFVHEALLAQRYAVPIIADCASACRKPAVHDLFGEIISPTGEALIQAFGRMISSAVREYPILARPTAFDLGEARIVSLDLDEVAKTGGAAADRQTAVMYMLARYIMARDFFLTVENVDDMPETYREHHHARIIEIREDPKRIVLDEFHRTSKVQAVRDQIIVDMREGRKWKVQVALLSQSLDDFDSVMVDFATSIYIMDSGPAQAIENTAKIFGLSPTAKSALRNRVHGPRAGGGTFIAQFATKSGLNTQLLTNTIGPIELWAFSTTAEDARVRNDLYNKIGPRNARKLLAFMYPSGSVQKVVEQRLASLRDKGQFSDEATDNVYEVIINELLEEYKKNPLFKQ